MISVESLYLQHPCPQIASYASWFANTAASITANTVRGHSRLKAQWRTPPFDSTVAHECSAHQCSAHGCSAPMGGLYLSQPPCRGKQASAVPRKEIRMHSAKSPITMLEFYERTDPVIACTSLEETAHTCDRRMHASNLGLAYDSSSRVSSSAIASSNAWHPCRVRCAAGWALQNTDTGCTRQSGPSWLVR